MEVDAPAPNQHESATKIARHAPEWVRAVKRQARHFAVGVSGIGEILEVLAAIFVAVAAAMVQAGEQTDKWE